MRQWAIVVGVCSVVGVAMALPAGVIAVFGGTAVALAFVVPRWALLVGAVVFARGVGAHFGQAVLHPLTITDVLLLIWIARTLVQLLNGHRPAPRAMPWLLVFCGWAWAVTLGAGVVSTPLMRITLYVIVAALLAIDNRPEHSPFRHAVVIYAAVVVVLSVPQAGGRVIGANIGDPAQFGILLFAALAITAASSWRYRGWMLALLTLAALDTRTRGVWLGLLVLGVVYVLPRLRRRQLVMVLAGAFALGLAVYGPVSQRFDLSLQSGTLRADSVRHGLEVAKAQPVTGHGWVSAAVEITDRNAVRYATDQALYNARISSPYNLFVNILVATGIVGVVLFSVFLWRLLGTPDRAVLLFLAAFIAFSLTEMTVYAASMGTILFFILAGQGAPSRLPNESVGKPTSADYGPEAAQETHGGRF